MTCKHEEITKILTGEIQSGCYGERFPPVRDLAARFHVSTRTMTKALKPLTHRGLIIPDGPRGCRVAKAIHPRPRTGIIGIFANINNIVPTRDPLLAPLMEYVKQDGEKPLLTNVPQTEVFDPDFWRSSYLDGYIFVYSTFNPQLAKLLKSEGIPFVSANRLPDHYNASWADFAHRPALEELTSYLLGSGSRRIALLDKPSFSNSINHISRVWQEVQEELQIPRELRYGAFGSPEDGQDYAEVLQKQFAAMIEQRGEAPDTIIIRNSRAEEILRSTLAEISTDIKFVSTEDLMPSPMPYSELARAVWELFKKIRDQKILTPECREIPYHLFG